MVKICAKNVPRGKNDWTRNMKQDFSKFFNHNRKEPSCLDRVQVSRLWRENSRFYGIMTRENWQIRKVSRFPRRKSAKSIEVLEINSLDLSQQSFGAIKNILAVRLSALNSKNNRNFQNTNCGSTGAKDLYFLTKIFWRSEHFYCPKKWGGGETS